MTRYMLVVAPEVLVESLLVLLVSGGVGVLLPPTVAGPFVAPTNSSGVMHAPARSPHAAISRSQCFTCAVLSRES